MDITKLENGIYAQIHTAKGDILLRLTYEQTPATVQGCYIKLQLSDL